MKKKAKIRHLKDDLMFLLEEVDKWRNKYFIAESERIAAISSIPKIAEALSKPLGIPQDVIDKINEPCGKTLDELKVEFDALKKKLGGNDGC